MAISKCPSCGNTSFEVKENEPRNATHKQIFIQCSSCGSVVSSTSYFDPASLIKQQENKLDSLMRDFYSLQRAVD